VKESDYGTHRDSVLVCCRCEYVTFSFPTLSNAAVIEPSFSLDFASTARAAWTSFALLAAAMVSSLQQILACLLKLLVDVESEVPRNRRTDRPFFPLPLQVLALHVKTWARRLSTYSMMGMGLKKAYIGAVQSFMRCSTH
jgi:hypothetical protein